MLRVIKPMPKGNKQSGKFPMSENLLGRFKKDIKEHEKKRLRELIGIAPKILKQRQVRSDAPARAFDFELFTKVRRIARSRRRTALLGTRIVSTCLHRPPGRQ